MNPATAAQPMPLPMVNDIAVPPRPAPAAPAQPLAVPLHVQTAAQPAPTPATSPEPSLVTNLVTDIPVHAPEGAAVPHGEDAELDKIMQDVGHELKKEDQTKQKHGFSLFKHKFKPTVIAPKPAAVPTQPAVAQQAAAVASVPAAAQPAVMVQAQPKAAPAAKTHTSTAPVMVVMVTVVVTGLLMAAAIYSYK